MVDEAKANLENAQDHLRCWPGRRSTRTAKLVKNGFATRELLDQRKQARDGAQLAQPAAEHRVAQAENALRSRRATTRNGTRVNIADNTLVAPRDGRIQYRRRQCRRGAARRRQGFHHARHGLCLHGRVSADLAGGQGQDRRRCPHPARRLSRPAHSRQSRHSLPIRRSSRRKWWRPATTATA